MARKTQEQSLQDKVDARDTTIAELNELEARTQSLRETLREQEKEIKETKKKMDERNKQKAVENFLGWAKKHKWSMEQIQAFLNTAEHFDLPQPEAETQEEDLADEETDTDAA